MEDFIDGIDLTPAAAPNPFGAAGYSGGGGGVAGFGEEVTVVGGLGGIDLGEVAGGGGNDHGRSPSIVEGGHGRETGGAFVGVN